MMPIKALPDLSTPNNNIKKTETLSPLMKRKTSHQVNAQSIINKS